MLNVQCSAIEAEWVTERFLESREAYINLERFLRGDITKLQLDLINSMLIGSLKADYTEEQRQLAREAIYENADEQS